MDAVVFEEGEGEILSPGPIRVRFLAQSPDHPVAITESTVPPGFPGPTQHRHAQMTDIFYVLEGTLAFHLEGERRLLGPGSFVMVPPGVTHTFANPGPDPARFLNIYQPAGNEQYVKEVAQRMADGQSPSQSEMAEIASRYDFAPVPETT